MNAMNYFSVNKLFSKLTFQNFHLVLHVRVCVFNCAYCVFNCCFLTLVNKIQTGLVDQMTVMVLNNSMWHSDNLSLHWSVFLPVCFHLLWFPLAVGYFFGWYFLHCFCLLAESYETIKSINQAIKTQGCQFDGQRRTKSRSFFAC